MSCLFGIFIYWNYWWKMTYWVLNTIHHLQSSFVQQLGGEVLHFSLHLWTAMNTSFGFLCLAWIRHIFTWNCHLSSDLNSEQWISTTFFIHEQQLTLFVFMFCIDPTKISACFNISNISYWRILTTINQFMLIFQDHSSSGSHSPIKKILPSSKIYDLLAPGGRIPTFHILALFGKPWYINWSLLVHWYQQCVAQVHELPQSYFDNKQDSTLFS